jgi:phosphatidate cytidylyltransferase
MSRGHDFERGHLLLLPITLIVVPMALFLSLYAMHPFLPLILIPMIWTNDTMAYLVGSFKGFVVHPPKGKPGSSGDFVVQVPDIVVILSP